MAINFPTAPTNDTLFPIQPTLGSWRYKSATPAYWRDMRGKALKNRCPNPSFQISQINVNADASNMGLYMSDSWYSYFTSDVASVRFQRIQSLTPKGGPHRFRATVSVPDTTPAAGEWCGWNTRIEGLYLADLQWGTANAVPVIVRFGWRSPAGTYTLGIRNDAVTRTYLFPFTISAGQANTDVEIVQIIPGDTTGVWPPGAVRHSLWYWSIMNVNSTSSGNINKWVAGNFLAASGNQSNGLGAVGTFEFFDVGIYPDPYRTGLLPDFEIPDISEEFVRMARYTQKCFSLKGIVTAATVCERMGSTLQVPMRTIPALSVHNSPSVWDGTGEPYVTSVTANYSTRTFVDCQLTCSAGGLTPPRPATMYLYSTNAEVHYIRANCEL